MLTAITSLAWIAGLGVAVLVAGVGVSDMLTPSQVDRIEFAWRQMARGRRQ